MRTDARAILVCTILLSSCAIIIAGPDQNIQKGDPPPSLVGCWEFKFFPKEPSMQEPYPLFPKIFLLDSSPRVPGDVPQDHVISSAWPDSRSFAVKPVFKLDCTPGAYWMGSWRIASDDSVEIMWSSGYGGLKMKLKSHDSDLYGSAIVDSDALDYSALFPRFDVLGKKISCDQPEERSCIWLKESLKAGPYWGEIALVPLEERYILIAIDEMPTIGPPDGTADELFLISISRKSVYWSGPIVIRGQAEYYASGDLIIRHNHGNSRYDFLQNAAGNVFYGYGGGSRFTKDAIVGIKQMQSQGLQMTQLANLRRLPSCVASEGPCFQIAGIKLIFPK